MLFYSLRKIINKTGHSSKRILMAFRAHASSRPPTSLRDPTYQYHQMDFSGESFMRNPHELLNNWFRWKPREVAEYIALASFRSYAQYQVDNNLTLDLFHSPVDQDTISNNRLLRLVDGRVHFYYEEDLKKREKLWH